VSAPRNGGTPGRISAPIRVGCAGWSLPRAQWPNFPSEGSHLERYAARFNAVEIDSSFYRPHRRSTYQKWASSVPAAFRFAVKTPRTLTHENRLANAALIVDAFLEEVNGLGEKLGPLLVQMPPSLAFDARAARACFAVFRSRYTGELMVEPRHASWFTSAAEALCEEFELARVAADPAPHVKAADPGAWKGLAYFRLHGSPRMYYSSYDESMLDRIANEVRSNARAGIPTWCIFDNTAEGAAIPNALYALDALDRLPAMPAV
jgi:uncharacterized protein YecE (DUF72 family)